jgi:two-component system, NtrC family, response regulator AtoC
MAPDPKDRPTDLARARFRSLVSRPHVLAIWEGGSTSRPVSEGESLTIGRADECDVVIDHPSVSRRHALLTVGSPSRVQDLGSANGTRIGDVVLRSSESAELERGQVITLGETMLAVHGAFDVRDRGPRSSSAPSSGRGLRDDVVINDEVTRRIHQTLALVARSSIPVLLLGETGVGKDVLSELLHKRSARAARPFVRVNCAAMPSALLESELFGHERGAFTGAAQAKAGLVEAADGGTMFLDEIGEMDPTMQSKLLHVLERGEVMRVGSLRPRPVDVRFVAATNRNIDRLVAEGAFRRDLYFRLKGVCLVVPPLASRPGEIAQLAALFLERACAKLDRGPLAIAPTVLECLLRYTWPGNVRELRNVMEHAAALCTGDIVELEHLPEECTLSGAPAAPPPSLVRESPGPELGLPRTANMRDEVLRATSSFEREQIVRALEECAGNQSAAARLLGISRRMLVARLDKYGIRRPIKDTEGG